MAAWACIAMDWQPCRPPPPLAVRLLLPPGHQRQCLSPAACSKVCVWVQAPGSYHMRVTILPQEADIDAVITRLAAFHASFMDKYRE